MAWWRCFFADQAGPLAEDGEDAALMSSDAVSATRRTRPAGPARAQWTKSVGKSIKGIKIGVPKEYRVEGMPEEIEKLWNKVSHG